MPDQPAILPDHPQPGHHSANGKHNPEVRHERTDASARGLMYFGVFFVLTAVLLNVVCWFVFTDFTTSEQDSQSKSPKIAEDRPTFPRDIAKIPEPRLQISDKADMADLLKRDNARLQGYGWVDQKANTVHVPIETVLSRMSDPKMAAAAGLKLAPVKTVPAKAAPVMVAPVKKGES